MPEKPPTDADLVAAVKAGHWPAFDQLYARHRDWVFRLAWRFTNDTHSAHDVLQEVFIYLAQKLAAPDFQLRASMTTFLYPAVKHTALALKRKRHRAGGSGGGVETLELAAPIPAAEPGTLRAQLAAVLQNLSDAHREVILLRFVDDLTLEEIATALAIPLGTVKSRLHHALADLRNDPQLRRHFDKE